MSRRKDLVTFKVILESFGRCIAQRTFNPLRTEHKSRDAKATKLYGTTTPILPGYIVRVEEPEQNKRKLNTKFAISAISS